MLMLESRCTQCIYIFWKDPYPLFLTPGLTIFHFLFFFFPSTNQTEQNENYHLGTATLSSARLRFMYAVSHSRASTPNKQAVLRNSNAETDKKNSKIIRKITRKTIQGVARTPPPPPRSICGDNAMYVIVTVLLHSYTPTLLHDRQWCRLARLVSSKARSRLACLLHKAGEIALSFSLEGRGG